jgi:5'-methylthioadenosine phosphorylase
MVTDYDCWREGDDMVDVATILAQLDANADIARRMVVEFARMLPPARAPSPIDVALDSALITAPASRDPQVTTKLDAICARVFREAD